MKIPENIAGLEYNISEIFYSIQGEGTGAGLPCTFIRLQGCMLRCTWCDTPYALDIKEKAFVISAEDIIREIEKNNCKLLCFTGGEPLFQENVYPLIHYLLDLDYTVTVETSGNIYLDKLDMRAIKILDLKCPGSGMSKSNDYRNIELLSKDDEVKFVVKDRVDFDWALKVINKYKIDSKCGAIIISPVFEKLNYKELAEWILNSKIQLRLQLQIHKYIWGPQVRGV